MNDQCWSTQKKKLFSESFAYSWPFYENITWLISIISESWVLSSTVQLPSSELNDLGPLLRFQGRFCNFRAASEISAGTLLRFQGSFRKIWNQTRTGLWSLARVKKKSNSESDGTRECSPSWKKIKLGRKRWKKIKLGRKSWKKSNLDRTLESSLS